MNIKQKQLLESYIEKQVKKILTEETVDSKITISDIEDKYKTQKSLHKELQKEYDKFMEYYNSKYYDIFYETSRLSKDYESNLISNISKHLINIDNLPKPNSNEIYMYKKKYKLSFLNNIKNEGLNYMIRNEQTLESIEGYIPNNLTVDKATKFLIDKIKEFEKKYKSSKLVK